MAIVDAEITHKSPASILRQDGTEVLAHSTVFRRLADRIGDTHLSDIRISIEDALRFLDHEYDPYAIAEQVVLCPEIECISRSKLHQSISDRHHREVRRLSEQLRLIYRRFTRHSKTTPGLDMKDELDLRSILYSLDATIRLHITIEAQIFLPVLHSALDNDELSLLVEHMKDVRKRHSHHTAIP
jgi:hypothetical protein